MIFGELFPPFFSEQDIRATTELGRDIAREAGRGMTYLTYSLDDAEARIGNGEKSVPGFTTSGLSVFQGDE